MELLVVITIIGLLVALIFPAVGAVIRSAMEYQCQNNISQLAKVVITYCQQNDGYFPCTGYGTKTAPSANDWLFMFSTPGPMRLYASQTEVDNGVLTRQKMVGKMDLFLCPTEADLNLRWDAPPMTRTVFRTGEAGKLYYVPLMSYVINGSITYGDKDYTAGRYSVRRIGEYEPTDFLFIEFDGDKANPNPNAYAIPDSGKWALTKRHHDGGHVACMDGHVEWMRAENTDDPSDENTFKAQMDKVTGGTEWYKTTGNRWNPG
jgi:type II secretory pathway pseudopilin PulG